jgi:hypothetical protein
VNGTDLLSIRLQHWRLLPDPLILVSLVVIDISLRGMAQKGVFGNQPGLIARNICKGNAY